MTDNRAMAAEILEVSAAGYAAAANTLFRENALRSTADEAGAAETWKTHFVQRILELAAAVRVGEPELFARRVTWLRRAFKARGSDEAQLRAALTSLRDALDRELPVALRPCVMAPIASALAALDQDVEAGGTTIDAADAAGRLALEFIAACLEGEPDKAVSLVMNAVESGIPVKDVYLRVILPVQKEVGQLWHLGEVSIAEERLVSETARQLMTLLAAGHAPTQTPRRKLLAASVAGNAHDLGLRVVSDLFRLAGWQSLFLGANVPGDEIARAAQSFGADLIVLNATLTTQLKVLGDSIAAIRQVVAGTPILVGGLVFEGAPELWRQLGADGYAARIDDAVAIGEALLAP